MRVKSPRPTTRGGESVSSGGRQTINKDPPAPLARGDFLRDTGAGKRETEGGLFNCLFISAFWSVPKMCAAGMTLKVQVCGRNR